MARAGKTHFEPYEFLRIDEDKRDGKNMEACHTNNDSLHVVAKKERNAYFIALAGCVIYVQHAAWKILSVLQEQ